MKVLTIIEDNPITGVVYGLKEIPDSVVRTFPGPDFEEAVKNSFIKPAYIYRKNTKQK